MLLRRDQFSAQLNLYGQIDSQVCEVSKASESNVFSGSQLKLSAQSFGGGGGRPGHSVPLICISVKLVSRQVKLISILHVQVKLVLTLKTVKEKLVREKLEVGGGNLPTVNLEVFAFFSHL